MKTKILSLILAFSFVLSAPMSAFAATAPITPVSPISSIEVTVPEEVAAWLAGSVEIALKHDLIPEALQSKYNQPLTRGSFLLCTFFTIPLQKFSLANLLISR